MKELYLRNQALREELAHLQSPADDRGASSVRQVSETDADMTLSTPSTHCHVASAIPIAQPAQAHCVATSQQPESLASSDLWDGNTASFNLSRGTSSIASETSHCTHSYRHGFGSTYLRGQILHQPPTTEVLYSDQISSEFTAVGIQPADLSSTWNSPPTTSGTQWQ